MTGVQTCALPIYAGIELFQRLGWPLHGFIAPAWLMSEGTRDALRSLPLHYTSDAQHLYRLPDFARIEAPGIVWSARSPWRRGVSKILSGHLEHRFQAASTIRLGLHPVDMRHEYARRYWLQILQRLIQSGRTPMTKAHWLATQHPAMRSAA